MVLLENEGISDLLFKTWLVYLIGHKGSMADTLDPNLKNIEDLYRNQFVTMTTRDVGLEQLHEVRKQLISELRGRLREDDRTFLLSLKRGEPRWNLLGLEGVEHLPAVKWKLHNLARMKPEARAHALARLEAVLKK